MGKVSYHPDDTFKAGFNLPTGLAEIVAAKAAVYQFPASRETGEQQAPATYAMITYQPLDKEGVSDGDPIDQFYKIGRTTEVQPGDAEGEALGDEVGTEGPTFATVDNNDWKPNDQVGWIVFCKHLRKRGVKEALLRRGVLADLVGITGEVENEQTPFTIGGRKVDRTMSIFKTIVEWPDSKKSGTVQDSDGAAPTDLQGHALDALTVVVGKMQADKTPSLTLARLGANMLRAAIEISGLLPKQQREISAMARDETFMAQAGEVLGFELKGKGITLA